MPFASNTGSKPLDVHWSDDCDHLSVPSGATASRVVGDGGDGQPLSDSSSTSPDGSAYGNVDPATESVQTGVVAKAARAGWAVVTAGEVTITTTAASS
jgi:hypothetical protein